MGWFLKRFYAQVTEFCDAVETALPHFETRNQHDLVSVLGYVRHVKQFLEASGQDPTWSYSQYPIRNFIGTALSWLPRSQTLFQFGNPQNYSRMQIAQLDHLLNLLNPLYIEADRFHPEIYEWFDDLHTEHEPATTSVSLSYLLTWPYIHTIACQVGVTVLLQETVPDACVHYHACYTPRLLAALVELFLYDWRRASTLYITSSQNDRHIILSLTMRGLLMTPRLWSMLRRPSFLPHISHLDEINGSIDPLVWDEGYGQGVIVRLPWANTLRGEQ